jgi:hypothetical protein
MSNEPKSIVRPSLAVDSKQEADLLYELLEKAAAPGPHARALANLYDRAKVIKAAFGDGS